ncbi:MAG: ROK family protein [Spirochaetales bacterium]|nr:ROK family protein [Spirochaetales bacterium]
MRKTSYESPSADSIIFNIIRNEGSINRTDLVANTGFAKSTVSLQINKLIETGIIQEIKPKKSENTVRKLQIEIVPDAGYVIGVFLGIHRLSISLFNLRMETILEAVYDLESILNPEFINRLIIKKIDLLISEAKIQKKSLWGIGLGFPFPVDFHQGISEAPPNLPLWHQYPVQAIYENHFSCPVLLDNDVNVMALGEAYSGIAQDENDFIFVKVGNGIGCGLFMEGRVYRGAKGSAGDIGHIALDRETKLCHCGNIGCLETIAAAPSIAQKGLEVAMTGDSPILQKKLAKNHKVTSKDVGEAAQMGDMFALRIIKESGKNLGSVLAKLVIFANPGMVVIGGGVTKSGTLYLSAIREEILRKATHIATIDLQIRYTDLQDKCGPIGSGRLIIEDIFSSRNFTKTIEGKFNIPNALQDNNGKFL